MGRTPERLPKDILFQMWKEEKLEDSPLLSSYLALDSGNQESIVGVSESTQEYEELFTQLFGREWNATILMSLKMLAHTQQLFPVRNEKLNRDQQSELLCSQLVFMGYEIGPDQEMLDSFAKDITTKVSSFGAINKTNIDNDLSTIVQVGLFTGANLRDLVDKRVPLEEQCDSIDAGDESLSLFRNFVNKELDN